MIEEKPSLFVCWVGGDLDLPTVLLYELDVDSTKTAHCERSSPCLFFLVFFTFGHGIISTLHMMYCYKIQKYVEDGAAGRNLN